MANVSFSLVLAANVARRLSDVYADGVDGGTPANNIPYRQVIIQTTGADTFIGGPGVTTADYGARIESAGDRFARPGPFNTGPIKLSDYYVIAAAPTTVHLLCIPY